MRSEKKKNYDSLNHSKKLQYPTQYVRKGNLRRNQQKMGRPQALS